MDRDARWAAADVVLAALFLAVGALQANRGWVVVAAGWGCLAYRQSRLAGRVRPPVGRPVRRR